VTKLLVTSLPRPGAVKDKRSVKLDQVGSILGSL